MSWRTVVISSRCKLDLKLGYMVIRGEATKRVFLDEIALLIIENPAVSMTGCLLNALMEKKIKVILCDGKHDPSAELVPVYGAHDCNRKLHKQLDWDPAVRSEVWTAIVREKIRKQAEFLRDVGKSVECDLLHGYLREITPGDVTNREGFAAKVYFNGIFGMEFTRSDSSPINAALNYGYAVLLSAFNREIVSSGYLTQLGICHDNVFNRFNLSCDFMEPFRILVDRKVYEMQPAAFSGAEKHELLTYMNGLVEIASAKQTVLNAITIYTRSVLAALNDNDPEKVIFYNMVEGQ